jgi:acetate kinase
MKVAVINSGRIIGQVSSIRESGLLRLLFRLLERIGDSESQHTHRAYGPLGTVKETIRRGRVTNHEEGFRFILSMPADFSVIKPAELLGIGHRVV